jgi:hypothetical protein
MFQQSLEGEAGRDPLGVGAEVHLQAQEDNELLFEGPNSLDVPLAGDDVPVHQ